MTEDISAEQRFFGAYEAIFFNWTALSFAIEHGMAGPPVAAARKRTRLMEEFFGFLKECYDKGKLVQLKYAAKQKGVEANTASRHDIEPHPDTQHALAEELRLSCCDLFQIELDDGSEMEVTALCMLLLATCKNNDFFLADALRASPAEAAQSRASLLQSCQARLEDPPQFLAEIPSDDEEEMDRQLAEVQQHRE